MNTDLPLLPVTPPLDSNAFAPIRKVARVLVRAEEDAVFKLLLNAPATTQEALATFGLDFLSETQRDSIVAASKKPGEAKLQLLDFLEPDWPAGIEKLGLARCPKSCIGNQQLKEVSNIVVTSSSLPLAAVTAQLIHWGDQQNYPPPEPEKIPKELIQLAVIISQL